MLEVAVMRRWWAAGLLLFGLAACAAAQPLRVPRVIGHLGAADLGLVINAAAPDSVALGEYYAKARGLGEQQVLRVMLPRKAVLTPDEFETLREAVAEHFGPATQALALAWTEPWAVACNSITGALTLGFDAKLCQRTCDASRQSPYVNSASTRPFSDLGIRPSMLLAARTPDEARAMIDRGVASDHTLGLRGALPATALFLTTTDTARNVRARLYPPAGPLGRSGVTVEVQAAAQLRPPPRVLLAQTGSARLNGVQSLPWVDGALADHLTSYGGQLTTGQGQSTALDWIEAGATASYGTVSEPCNHLQKFPHPKVLLAMYLQGGSAIEAYWKSVAWPQQGVFIGEPLAAPFSRR